MAGEEGVQSASLAPLLWAQGSSKTRSAHTVAEKVLDLPPTQSREG